MTGFLQNRSAPCSRSSLEVSAPELSLRVASSPKAKSAPICQRAPVRMVRHWSLRGPTPG